MNQENQSPQALLEELKQKQARIEELEIQLAEKNAQTTNQNILVAIQLSDTCQQLIRTIQRRIHADRVTLFLVDHHQKDVILSLICGSHSKVALGYAELQMGLSGQVLKTHNPVLSQSPDDEIQNTVLYEKRLQNDAESLFVVPLFAYDENTAQVVGTITAINRKHQAILTAKDIDIAQDLIHGIQIRLDDVQIFQETFQAQFVYKTQYDIVHNLSQGVCLISQQTLHIVHVNPRFEDIFGYSRKDLINQPSDFFPTDELTHLQLQFSQTTNLYDYWQSEIQNTHKNGRAVWCTVNVSSADHPQYGSVWVCVYTDITQLKQEEERHHHQAKLLDFVMDAVVSGDMEFTIETWNKAAETLYGWTEEEALGRYATDLFQTEYFDKSTPEEIQNQYRQQGEWRGEMIHHHKDGTPIPVRGTSGTIRNDQGEAVGVVTVLRDISDELEAARTLKVSEERYRIISEFMSDYAYLYNVDENGKWFRVWTTAEAFTRVTGYKRDEIPDIYIYGLYHPDEVERVTRDIDRTLAGEDTDGEYRIITKDGQHKWLDVRRRVLWDESHQRIIGFYGAGRDITTRKQAEEHLIEYNKEKERVNVLQSFIQDASHDLKTPLSTINTSIYILRKLATTDKQLEQLSKLEFNVNRLAKLIEDMFNMSRLDLINRLSLTYVDLNLYLRDIIAIHRPIATNKNIEIMSEIQDKPLIVLADMDSLMQAMTNILENAIWFTSENGHITVRSYPEEHWVVIAIEDDGIGISPDEIPNIFKRFYRGDKSRSTNTVASTGLGLSIARKITELHNGKIDVESTLDEGSRFIIRLPRPE